MMLLACKFNSRRLKGMRNAFLALSIDLSSIVRDVKEFHLRSSRIAELPVFTLEDPAWLSAQVQEAGGARLVRNYSIMLLKRQERDVKELSGEDKDYRETLSAVATLGASIDTFKVGRVALWVALISLAVSMVALLLADVGRNTVLHHLPGLITQSAVSPTW
ncbi:hypothetical protein ACIQRE_13815 [Streptomyces griseoluteus]|uniref:hypothetical protein n=1 Tax=Streptomyces griseoluteus TaxID=29306 RepID=UPI00381F3FC4